MKKNFHMASSVFPLSPPGLPSPTISPQNSDRPSFEESQEQDKPQDFKVFGT